MAIVVKGHRLVDLNRTSPTTARAKFKDGVKSQIASLRQDAPPARAWYWPKSDGGYGTDVRYGNASLLGKGKGFVLKDKEALGEFYEKLLAQCDAGDFDTAIQEMRQKIGAKLKGKAGKAKAKK